MTFRDPLIAPKKQQWQQQSAPDVIHTNIINFPNPIPFHQTEWPRIQRVKLSLPDVSHTDINNFPNPIPFHQTDWSQTRDLLPAFTRAPDQPYNLSLYNVAITITLIGQTWM